MSAPFPLLKGKVKKVRYVDMRNIKEDAYFSFR